MRLTRLLAGFAALAALAFSAPATAQFARQTTLIPNELFEGVSVLTNTAFTTSSTTAVDLPGTPLVVQATQFDPAKRLVTVCFSADVTKSTGGAGTIGLAVDGVQRAETVRYSSSGAARNTIGGCFSFARTTQNAITVSLQAASTDANAFAVQNAQMIVVQRAFN